MEVYMSEIDYHLFKQGHVAVCFKKKPSDSSEIPFRSIYLMKEEMVEPLTGYRLLVRKSV